MPSPNLLPSAIVLLAALSASAAERLVDRSLEELMALDIPVVNAASKFSQKANKAPASVSVITAKDIKQFGYRTLGDALNSQAGIYLQYDRLYQGLGIRGFQRAGEYNNRVAFLLNGARTNDVVFGSAAIGQDFFLDLDLIERVEVIRGASSSLYGNNAVYGVVNVITKRGGDINGIEASTHGGSLGTYGGRVTAGKKYANGFEALISGSFKESDGNETLDFPGLGTAVNRDQSRTHSLFGKFAYGDFTLEVAHSDQTKGIPSAAYETIFNDHRSMFENNYTVASLKYETTFANDVSILARALFQDYKNSGVYPYAAPDGVSYEFSGGRFGSLELLISKKVWDKHQLSLGVEARQIFHIDQHGYTLEPYSLYLHEHQTATEAAVYAQGDFELLPNLSLSLGARLDNTKSEGSLVSPRIGLIWAASEGTTFKAIAGRAFRSPNAYESNPSGIETIGNLGRESTETVEMVWEQKLASNWQLKVAAYNGTATDLIELVENRFGDYVFTNSLHAEFRGVETEVRGRFAGGIEARASYSVQRTVNKRSGERLSNSPRHLGKLHLSAPIIADRLNVALEVLASSSAQTLEGNTEGSFCVANLHLLSMNIVPGLELSAGIYNLLDQRFGHPSSGDHPLVDRIEQDGRTFGVKATYKF